MLVANTPKGKLKFKNHWDMLSEKEILWYQDIAIPLMGKAYAKKDSGFSNDIEIVDEEAFHTLNFGLLTLCCKNKKKLLRMPSSIVQELLEKGAISFYQQQPLFSDQRQKDMQAMSVGQFAIADMIYREFQATKQDEEVNLFAAAIDLPFEKENIEDNAKAKAKLSEAHKRYLMFRFQLFLNGIVDRSPLAFDSNEDTGEPMEWRESMLQMAKDGPFGNFENIEKNVRFVDYAAEMHRVKKEYKASVKDLKKNK